jgi:membrane dipeptidase
LTIETGLVVTPGQPGFRPLLWEQHCCLPLLPTADLRELLRYREAAAGYVSVNAGYAPQDARAATEILTAFRGQVDRHPGLVLATGVEAVLAARATGRIAVGFDLEDSNPLDGRLELVRHFYDLGVRTLLPSYNYRNEAGSGCLDTVDEGLTPYGRRLIAEMNAVGMVPDGSHCSARTGLGICEVTTRPMVYSHSCLRGLWDHERNITDEQARACAATDGVIGITGVGIFLGANDASIEAMVRHIDYAVDLVGPRHVGIGSDFTFDHRDFNRELAANPHLFPECYRRWGAVGFVAPERLARLAGELFGLGYPGDAVAGILGENFLRVARESWQPADAPGGCTGAGGT